MVRGSRRWGRGCLHFEGGYCWGWDWDWWMERENTPRKRNTRVGTYAPVVSGRGGEGVTVTPGSAYGQDKVRPRRGGYIQSRVRCSRVMMSLKRLWGPDRYIEETSEAWSTREG